MRSILVLFLLWSASATAVQLRGFFPAVCNGVPSKGVVAYEPRAAVEARDIRVTFKLALMACLEGADRFVSYQPRAEEWVQVYAIRQSNLVTLKMPIPVYAEGESFSQVEFAIPRSVVTGAVDFRVDIFLYQDMIPLKLTLSENGAVTIN